MLSSLFTQSWYWWRQPQVYLSTMKYISHWLYWFELLWKYKYYLRLCIRRGILIQCESVIPSLSYRGRELLWKGKWNGSSNWYLLLTKTPSLSYINCNIMNSLGKWIWEMGSLGDFKKQSAKSYTPSPEKAFNVLHFKNTSESQKVLLFYQKS